MEGFIILSIVLLVLSISGVIGIFCWQYTINTWLVYFEKKPAVLWWHGFLIGLVPGFGSSSIVCAVATYIAMLFLQPSKEEN